jgi:hypothetical protein
MTCEADHVLRKLLGQFDRAGERGIARILGQRLMPAGNVSVQGALLGAPSSKLADRQRDQDRSARVGNSFKAKRGEAGGQVVDPLRRGSVIR